MNKSSHIVIRNICMLLCLAVFVCLAGVFFVNEKSDTVGFDSTAIKSLDRVIAIDWDIKNFVEYRGTEVSIFQNEKEIFSQEFDSLKGRYDFVSGEHGKSYTIKLKPKKRGGEYGDEKVSKAVFLDYDKLPDMPTFFINTYSGTEPTYKEAKKPEDIEVWGYTITDKEILSGELTFIDKDEDKRINNIKINVRGNTSAVDHEKKPYKIEFENPVNFLGLGNDKEYSDWILLNNGNELNTFVSNETSRIVDTQWQPDMRFINVFLNNDFKGVYGLTPSVSFEYAYKSDFISEDGYMFENNMYWWDGEEPYFRLSNQIPMLAYTCSYPTMKSIEDPRLKSLQNYMQTFENLILSDDDTYKEYIDIETFAKWILIRDMLGEWDSGGSNMFFYKYDYDEKNITSSKVKIGPVWDSDGAFVIENEWSPCREEDIFWYNKLFEDEEFVAINKNEWEKVKDTYVSDINTCLTELETEYGEALDESWRMEQERWGEEIPCFSDQKNKIISYLEKRVIWLDENI